MAGLTYEQLADLGFAFLQRMGNEIGQAVVQRDQAIAQVERLSERVTELESQLGAVRSYAEVLRATLSEIDSELTSGKTGGLRSGDAPKERARQLAREAIELKMEEDPERAILRAGDIE